MLASVQIGKHNVVHCYHVVFILGNDYLHDITSQAHYTLRVDLADFDGNTKYAVYSGFAIASETNKYRLSLGAYSGTAGDRSHVFTKSTVNRKGGNQFLHT